GQCPAFAGDHDSRPHVDHADAGLRCWSSRRLPLFADIGEEPLSGGALLVEDLITAVAVVSGRRSTHQDLRLVRQAGKILAELAGSFDAAIANSAFLVL